MIIKSFSINYEKLFSDCKVNLIYGENFHLKTEILNKLTQIFKKNELGKSEIVKKFTNLYVYPYEYL